MQVGFLDFGTFGDGCIDGSEWFGFFLIGLLGFVGNGGGLKRGGEGRPSEII